MKNIQCPECGSTNFQKQAGYAAEILEGESAQEGYVVPNECREENCRHKWFNEN